MYLRLDLESKAKYTIV